MRNSIILLFSILIYTNVYSQISQGGFPESLRLKLDNRNIETITIPAPDLIQIANEDAIADEQFAPRRFSVLLPLDVNPSNSGTWTNLADGYGIWQLKINSENALALSLYFNDFHLTKNTSLFIYDENGNQVKGAYTSLNNHNSRLFATELIYGETIIIELVCATANEMPDIHISEVGYAYRDIPDIEGEKGFGGSDLCEVNIGCSPEGTGWQDIKKGVVRIQVRVSSSGYWCTGSLINNVRNDNTPYLLTADHCAYQLGHYATSSDLNQWLFYFNYESQTCENPSVEPALKSMVGASKVAQGGNRGSTGSDFYLIMLNQNIPYDYNPYFVGWSAEFNGSSSGVTIHHPQGDIKKVSTYSVPLITIGWSGNSLQSHWKVFWTETDNGWGVTEGGSSGSPLFNDQGKIIGTLTGGYAACESSGNIGPDKPDYYGKFSYHWLSNGDADTARLKPWLDPDNTGIIQLEGKILSIHNNLVNAPDFIQIFPNPSSDFININFTNFEPSDFNLIVFDILGKQIKSLNLKTDTGNLIIDIRDIPDGLYLFKFNFENNKVIKRIVKRT